MCYKKIDDKYYDSCPECNKTGKNISANGASGRSGILINGITIVEEDTPGNLTRYHYLCKDCNISFTSKNGNVPTDGIVVYACGSNYIK